MQNKKLFTQDIRDSFFDTIYELSKVDDDVVIVTNDMDIFSLKKFKKNYPQRFFNMGVAEQNMVNFSCGLASQGKRVIIYGILPFLVYRCFEQIKFNLCSMNLPITIVGVGTGYSFSFDGPTHHATHDIGALLSLPEIKLFNPSTPKNAKKIARDIFKSNNPSFVRLDKGVFNNADSYFQSYNGFDIVSKLTDINILCSGSILNQIEKLVTELNSNDHKIGLIDVHKIKPFPKKLINLIKETTKKIIIVEENFSGSGVGSHVSYLLAKHKIYVDISFHCVKDLQSFNYGQRAWLIKKEGLSLMKLKNSLNNEI